MDYKKKYLKYKAKYLSLKKLFNQSGGYLNRKEDKEIVEVIHGQTDVKLNNTDDTIKYLQKNNLIKKEDEQFYVFDLHNVLDLLDQNYQINRNDKQKIICCSYVGRYSDLRDVARSEVKARIASGQIDWGVLVFRRGKKRRNDDPFRYHADGSKAWFCHLVKGDYFFDDSKDHIESVKSKPNLDIKATQIFDKQMLINQIEKIKK